ncbi:MAG: universal stress protein [Chloroflexales bacterium]|nr:universal stress protein [Chloroflexales bacterium]
MFERILVPLDGSSLAECVLPHVIPLAGMFNAHVMLLRVLEPPRDKSLAQAIDPFEWHMWKAEVQTYLDLVRSQLQEAGLAVEAVLLEGQAAQCIMEFARQHSVNLTILSSHGQSGLSDWNIGGVVQKLVVRAHTTMMIVPAYQAQGSRIAEARYQRLVIPLDGSQRAECVLPLALHIAQARGSQLLLVHVVRSPEMPRHVPLSDAEHDLMQQVVERNRQAAANYLERLQSQLAFPTQTRLLVSDNVVVALYQLLEQEHADLVLLTAHGYSGEATWPYGSVAASFIAHASFPLLIVQDRSVREQPASPAELAAREHGGH